MFGLKINKFYLNLNLIYLDDISINFTVLVV